MVRDRKRLLIPEVINSRSIELEEAVVVPTEATICKKEGRSTVIAAMLRGGFAAAPANTAVTVVAAVLR